MFLWFSNWQDPKLSLTLKNETFWDEWWHLKKYQLKKPKQLFNIDLWLYDKIYYHFAAETKCWKCVKVTAQAQQGHTESYGKKEKGPVSFQ